MHVRQSDRNRKRRQNLCGPLTVAMFCTAATAYAAPAKRLESGRFEQLQLAVASDGAVAGAYGEEEGVGVTRSCEFDLTGHLDPGGSSARIVVHSPGDPDHPGRLVAMGDGVGLDVAKLGELPGSCEAAAPVGPGQPTLYGRTGRLEGSWFANVVVARARFHSAAAGAAGKGYLVKDDTVVIGKRQGGRWEASYTAPDGRKTHGWIDASDLAALPHD